MNPKALPILTLALLLSSMADGVASGQGSLTKPDESTAHLSKCTYHGHISGTNIGHGTFIYVSRSGETYGFGVFAKKAMTVRFTLRVSVIHFKQSQTVKLRRNGCTWQGGTAFIATNIPLQTHGKYKYQPKGAILTVSDKGKVIWRHAYPWVP